MDLGAGVTSPNSNEVTKRSKGAPPEKGIIAHGPNSFIIDPTNSLDCNFIWFFAFVQHGSAAVTPFNPVPLAPLINLFQNPGSLIVALDPCAVPNLKRKFQRVKCRRCHFHECLSNQD